jgi:hypothetical protein
LVKNRTGLNQVIELGVVDIRIPKKGSLWLFDKNSRIDEEDIGLSGRL